MLASLIEGDDLNLKGAYQEVYMLQAATSTTNCEHGEDYLDSFRLTELPLDQDHENPQGSGTHTRTLLIASSPSNSSSSHAWPEMEHA